MQSAKHEDFENEIWVRNWTAHFKSGVWFAEMITPKRSYFFLTFFTVSSSFDPLSTSRLVSLLEHCWISGGFKSLARRRNRQALLKAPCLLEAHSSTLSDGFLGWFTSSAPFTWKRYERWSGRYSASNLNRLSLPIRRDHAKLRTRSSEEEQTMPERSTRFAIICSEETYRGICKLGKPN